MNHYETFLELHRGTQPLFLANAWDAASAKAFQDNGFKAVATSSAAVANSLGYEDGEKIPFELLALVVRRIMAGTKIPVSVDLESGYSHNIAGIIKNLDQLYDLGVVGFNIEDSLREEKRALRPVDEFCQIISALRNHLDRSNKPMFLNARTDAFLLANPAALDETIQRAAAYQQAGASGIFVPFLCRPSEIAAVTASTKLPVNVLCMAELPSFMELADLGIKRISMGSSVFRALSRKLTQMITTLQADQHCRSIF
jgi:2-methylisocitrate lyase-like PEP mutase family enzyme